MRPLPLVAVIANSGVTRKRLPAFTGAPEGWEAEMREKERVSPRVKRRGFAAGLTSKGLGFH